MDTGERRIPPAVPLLAALIFAGGVALWPGGGDADGSAVQASAELSADELEVSTPPRVNSRSARLTEKVGALIRGALGEAVALGAKREDVQVSVLVKELGVDGDLVEVDSDKSLKPASNMKLATTAAALALLGGEAMFETTVWANVAPADGQIAGDLVVRAGADPLFDAGLEGAVRPLIAPVIQDLRAAGVERVTGDLVLDLGTYQEAHPAPGWPSPGQHFKDYCALSSGFTANAGCVSIFITPSGSLGPATVEVLPLGHGAKVEFDVATLKPGEVLETHAVVRPDLIKVWGEIPQDVRRFRSRFAHPDPVGLFGAVFRSALHEGGVAIDGVTRLQRDAQAGHLLARLERPVAGALGAINTDSNNAVADQLFLKVGADISGEGDRDGAARAASEFFSSLGVSAEGYRQIDGSGLSKNNRISARQLVTLLDACVGRGDEGAAALMQSLALAGETGTLEDRMGGTGAAGMVRAKSGFINGTSALSGVAMTESERFLLFSILVNYKPKAGLNRAVWKPMQDSICEAIVHGP